jgi:hypothetical protein
MIIMKKIFLPVLLTAITSLSFYSCKEGWDEHYENSGTVITNDQVLIVDKSTEEYLNNNNLYSDMYGFLNQNGIFEKIKQKDQLHTLFVVENKDFKNVDQSQALFIANSHVTDISISPSNLYDGERILMWHGKYVNVGLDSLALLGTINHIKFNNTAVKQVIKTNDGYVYVLENMINTPQSLYDIINGLDANYSIFKNLVMAENVLNFDKANSKPIGVDNTGNTVYDSVFTISNPFFDNKGFDLTSEALTATVLIPSNEVFNQAMSDAKKKLADWEMTRDTNIMKKWILEVAFFNKKYTPEDIAANVDISSIYGRQWRNTIQKIDTENPINMSNGIAYKIKWMKIPNNVLMYRLKDFFYYYENCSEDQKQQYFESNNLAFDQCSTEVAAWTPLSGVWPAIENRTLIYSFVDKVIDGFTLNFTPIKRVMNIEGGYEVKPWKIPPGEYRLCMGFKQNLNLDVEISVNDSTLGVTTLGSATTFHYDRGGTGYPEGYQEALTAGSITHSKKGNYDRDGGQISASVRIKGDAQGNPAPIKIKIENTTFGTATKMVFYHWCLRPTANNY